MVPVVIIRECSALLKHTGSVAFLPRGAKQPWCYITVIPLKPNEQQRKKMPGLTNLDELCVRELLRGFDLSLALSEHLGALLEFG